MNGIYRGMDRSTLDAAYNNTKAVPNFSEILSDFQVRSTETYGRAGWRRDLRYGQKDRQRFDLIQSGKTDAPTLIYIHGGYWQTLAKEDFAFVAEGPLGAGFNVVLAEYTLAPQASMTQMVGEIGELLLHLAASRGELGLGFGPICLAGHSAGGHLSLVHRAHPLIAGVLAISPLVDLEPIGLSWLNEKLRLSASEIESYSPIRHLGRGPSTWIAVGSSELPELVRHAEAYASAARTAGEAVVHMAVPQANHFSVLEALARPDGLITKALQPR